MQWRKEDLCLVLRLSFSAQEEFRNITICQATVGKPWVEGKQNLMTSRFASIKRCIGTPQITFTQHRLPGDDLVKLSLRSSKTTQQLNYPHCGDICCSQQIRGQPHGQPQWHHILSGFIVFWGFGFFLVFFFGA